MRAGSRIGDLGNSSQNKGMNKCLTCQIMLIGISLADGVNYNYLSSQEREDRQSILHSGASSSKTCA